MIKRLLRASGFAWMISFTTTALAQDHPVPPSLGVPQQRFVDVMGQRIAYYDIGEGPVLVLVHGSGTSAAIDWAQVIKPLSKSFRVIAPDNIGHGQSAKPNIAYSYESYTAFLAAFLTDLGLTHVNLAGESMGGGIVTYYAIKAAQKGSTLPRVDKLVITDGAVFIPGWGLPPDTTPLPKVASTPRPIGMNVLPPTWQDYKAALGKYLFANQSYATDAYAKDAWSLAAGYNNGIAQRNAVQPNTPYAEVVSSLFATELGSISEPTLIVWGEKDQLIPVANSEVIHKWIRGSRLLTYKNVGHAPAIEQPNRYIEDVRQFLIGQ